jgi:hypothetical protein
MPSLCVTQAVTFTCGDSRSEWSCASMAASDNGLARKKAHTVSPAQWNDALVQNVEKASATPSISREGYGVLCAA